MKKKSLLITVIAILGFAIVSMAQTVPSYVPTSGLVGWWPFTGNANDSSGNGNNGTVLAGTILAFDRFNNINSSYEVDGINCPDAKGISLPCSIDNSLEYSVSVWYKTLDSTKTDQSIFNSFPHSYIAVNYNLTSGFGNKTCSFYGNGGWLVYGGTINWNTYNLTEWHHILVVKSTSSIKYYQDGNLEYSQPMLAGYNSGSFTSIVIGAISVNGGSQCYETFKGKLDDIGVWNRALDSCEIKDLYFASLGNCCHISISTQPLSQSASISNNVQFTTSSDSSATYQWQTDLGVGFQNINSVGQYSGTNKDTLRVANVTMGNNNQPFRCIVSSGACSDTSTAAVLTVINANGINETLANNLFTVYPNPAKSQINVKADASLIGSSYTVYNNIGKVTLTGKINAENTVLDLGHLSSGVYLFSIGDHLKQMFTVVKE